jgi:hypothetical protein
MFAAGKTDGAAAVAANYIEDVFSTYLYTGNGSTQTITNGIDLSTKGGLVWIKTRSSADNNSLYDTARGAQAVLISNNTAAQSTVSGVTAFNANGFALGSDSDANGNNKTTVSWSFRKQPKFFDVVTYTGNGSSGRTLSHSLASQPGFILIKRTDGADPWLAFARLNNTDYSSLRLNTTAAGSSYAQSDIASSTVINVGYINQNIYGCNISGETYVAYIFAHDAGGFGLTGTDNVISCGSYTGNALEAGPTITLGYEPQWVMIKRATGTANWVIIDNMRRFVVKGSNSSRLYPNLSAAEETNVGIQPLATGFQPVDSDSDINANGSTYIYIAIRRGPMKVPTSGTSVYQGNTYTGNATLNTTVAGNFGFPVDLMLLSNRNANANTWVDYAHYVFDRLRGANVSVATSRTASESSGWATYHSFSVKNSIGWGLYGSSSDNNYINNSGGTWVANGFRRAPSFFDEVCYTGTGSATTFAHNLGVVPELMIVKRRNSTSEWKVYTTATGNGNELVLNSQGSVSATDAWNDTTPTASVFSIGSPIEISGATYVAYLFATCAGVSKVGSYTGNGSTQTIDCGFTGGARFVLIKRTDDTGGWYVYDTARGMTVLTDPYLLINSSAAEVATLGSVTTVSTGFAVNASVLAAINTNSANYIFLAIA